MRNRLRRLVRNVRNEFFTVARLQWTPSNKRPGYTLRIFVLRLGGGESRRKLKQINKHHINLRTSRCSGYWKTENVCTRRFVRRNNIFALLRRLSEREHLWILHVDRSNDPIVFLFYLFVSSPTTRNSCFIGRRAAKNEVHLLIIIVRFGGIRSSFIFGDRPSWLIVIIWFQRTTAAASYNHNNGIEQR